MHLASVILIFALQIQLAWTTGRFVNPAGIDGQISLHLGQQFDVLWTGTDDSNMLSLGVMSTTNQTVSWLLSNSTSSPKSFHWRVNVRKLGFNLSSSRLFQLMVVSGKNGAGRFKSSIFSVNATHRSSSDTVSSQSTTSTNTTSVNTMASIPAAGDQSTLPAPQNPLPQSSSNGLSTGAMAGIGIAVGLGSFMLVSVLCILFIKRQRAKKEQQTEDQSQTNVTQSSSPTREVTSYLKHNDFYKTRGHSGPANGHSSNPSHRHELAASQPERKFELS